MEPEEKLMAGYDIGVGLSGSASSGASLSGATDASGGGNYGGTSYGAGAYVLTDQSGSIGASAGGVNLAVIAAIGLVIVTLVIFIFRRRT
ncbi:MAG: hypothetical protein H7X97_07090 [Opitutaceae bacterium]|nr:hypothetical protein [Verrucomicrobiales bacterium]